MRLHGGLGFLGGDFVQADGGLQHQQHVKAVLADILHHPGDLLALNDRLVDGLAQLLNEFAQTGCHGYLQERRPARAKGAGCGVRFIYLTAIPAQEQPESGGRTANKHLTPGRCYHHKRNETTDHRPRPGHRAARRRANGWRAAGGAAQPQPPRMPARQPVRAQRRTRRLRQAARESRARRPEPLPRASAAFCVPSGAWAASCGLKLPVSSSSLPVIVFTPEPLAHEGELGSRPRSPDVSDYTALVLLFLYLGVTSFWRARRK